MLLSITTTHTPATDLGYLLAKHPERCQSFGLNFGSAHVFYPEASEARCTACLLVEVDPVALVRGKSAADAGALEQYVNDRPYVASSFVSVAIAQVFGSALNGTCRDRPDLVDRALPFHVAAPVVRCRGGEGVARELFEPLGYRVALTRLPLDPAFPEWGESRYWSLELSIAAPLRDVLSHLYVLLPVLDDAKHYWVSHDEVEKLVRKGEGWLASHPSKERIAERYLKHRESLERAALARLVSDEEISTDPRAAASDDTEVALEKKLSLNQLRMERVAETLRSVGAKSVVDLGCGEGRLLAKLLDDRTFDRVVGVDVSPRSLEIAARRLRLDELPERRRARVELLQGSLVYRDRRLAGFDAACAVEVVEHIEPDRLPAFERAIFEAARPSTVLITTPNSEYNCRFTGLSPGSLRHRDHRFEWTRAEFEAWGRQVAARHGYEVRFEAIGDLDEAVGAPTQMGVFSR